MHDSISFISNHGRYILVRTEAACQPLTALMCVKGFEASRWTPLSISCPCEGDNQRLGKYPPVYLSSHMKMRMMRGAGGCRRAPSHSLPRSSTSEQCQDHKRSILLFTSNFYKRQRQGSFYGATTFAGVHETKTMLSHPQDIDAREHHRRPLKLAVLDVQSGLQNNLE